VPAPSFLLFLCFRKVTQEIFSELDETKAERLEIYRSFQTVWGHEGPTQIGRRVPGLGRAPMCETASVPSDDAPSPIKTPRWEKPKYPIRIPERYHDPPPSSIRDWEGPEALPGTLPERGIATGGLFHHHACLRSDE
jgi:hypothetical protein